eukprot:760027-Hanusia_phi.AAC.2
MLLFAHLACIFAEHVHGGGDEGRSRSCTDAPGVEEEEEEEEKNKKQRRMRGRRGEKRLTDCSV